MAPFSRPLVLLAHGLGGPGGKREHRSNECRFEPMTVLRLQNEDKA
jgi:hypothetical protein